MLPFCLHNGNITLKPLHDDSHSTHLIAAPHVIINKCKEQSAIHTMIENAFVQGSGPSKEEEVTAERYPSAIPFLPPLSASTVKYYYQFYAFAVGTIILFGGLLSPVLEVNMGLGGGCQRLVMVSTVN